MTSERESYTLSHTNLVGPYWKPGAGVDEVAPVPLRFKQLANLLCKVPKLHRNKEHLDKYSSEPEYLVEQLIPRSARGGWMGWEEGRGGGYSFKQPVFFHFDGLSHLNQVD